MLDEREIDDALSLLGETADGFGKEADDAYEVVQEALHERVLAVNLMQRASVLLEEKLAGPVSIWFADFRALQSECEAPKEK